MRPQLRKEVATVSDANGATDTPLLEVKSLVKQFSIPGTKAVVHACSDVTLTVRRGETLGIIGESGSGKTTLGRCVLRLLEPTSGQVLFEGNDLTSLSRKEMRKLRTDVQIVFQEPFDSLNPQMTVGRQIGEPLRIHIDLGKTARKTRVLELLELVGLPPSTYEALPRQLSPGALQRASIARAMSTDPKLIVLDEPTSALAPEAEAEVIGLLKRIQEETGIAYIFISHDLSLVGEICDSVAIMYLSQVIESGTREQVFDNPRHPYSRALLAAVLLPDPSKRRDDAARAERLEGEIPSPIDLPAGCFLASRCHFVRDRCESEPQQLLSAGEDGHDARCWRVAENDLKTEEIERLRAERRADTADASA